MNTRSKLKISTGSGVLVALGLLLLLAAIALLVQSWPGLSSLGIIAFVAASFAATSFALAALSEFRSRLQRRAKVLDARQERERLRTRDQLEKLRIQVETVHEYARSKAGTQNAMIRKQSESIAFLETKYASLRKSYGDAKFEHQVADRARLRQVFRMAVVNKVGRETFSAADIKTLAAEYIDSDPMAVYWLVETGSHISALSLSARRRLANNLRARGYLENSLSILETVVTEANIERDMLALNQRRNEIAVMKHGYTAKLTPRGAQYQALPGHVLHVVGKALPTIQTGYTLRTHYTVLAQRAAGIQASVVSQSGQTEDLHELTTKFVDDVAYYTLPGVLRRTLTIEEWLDSNISQLAKLVEEMRPALLHAHSDFLNAVSARVVGSFFNIPVVYESRGFWEETWLSRMMQKFSISNTDEMERLWGLPDAYLWRLTREHEARKDSDHVFTLANVMKEHILKLAGPVEMPSISLVPNAVSPTDFPILRRDESLSEELGISADSTVIGYVSSIVEYEGIDVLIDAFEILCRDNSAGLRLLIVGDGPMLSGLKRQAEDLGIESKVIFTGHVPHEEILKYYSAIDVFVVPRRPVRVCELVTPLKPFEAFSTGRAVVMSNVRALSEIAEDSGSAEMFEAGNPDSLAAVLRNLITDPRRMAEMSERGAAWVRTARSWDANAQVYLSKYKELGVERLEPAAVGGPAHAGSSIKPVNVSSGIGNSVDTNAKRC